MLKSSATTSVRSVLIRRNPLYSRQGFTLIELLIVIAGLLLLGAAAFPIYGNLQVSAQLNETTSQLVQATRTARERSMAGLGDSQHGVYIDINSGADRYILYQGSSYSGRDQDYDRVIDLDGALSFSATWFTLIGSDVDINFSKGLGSPGNIGTLTLTHEVSGSSDIVVNSLGTIGEN